MGNGGRSTKSFITTIDVPSAAPPDCLQYFGLNSWRKVKKDWGGMMITWWKSRLLDYNIYHAFTLAWEDFGAVSYETQVQYQGSTDDPLPHPDESLTMIIKWYIEHDWQIYLYGNAYKHSVISRRACLYIPEKMAAEQCDKVYSDPGFRPVPAGNTLYLLITSHENRIPFEAPLGFTLKFLPLSTEH